MITPSTAPGVSSAVPTTDSPPPHPRTIGWLGTTALAMGGSNLSLFLLAVLFVGQGAVSGHGSAAVPLLIAGLLLSLAAAPGWIELVLLFPNRVGGIAATCAEAFRPYSPILANLAGVGYWWGWVPVCGYTALLSASLIHEWYFPLVPVNLIATALVLFMFGMSLCGVKWVARVAIPIATASAALAFLSALLPVIAGQVDWHQATTFHLTTPFGGWFGTVSGVMAGLYLVGFAAPAFEAATCHVGETIDPIRAVPRAVCASAAMAVVYFAILPVVWLGALGPEPLGGDLAIALGPVFAPLFGSAAKGVAIWFVMLSSFHGTLQPLAGASRTLSQLSDDGLIPRSFGLRSSNDTPWVATLTTAAFAMVFLYLGDPIWLIASANFTYLIGISLPSIAVWLLRRDRPELPRPWRAPQGTIGLGLASAMVWGLSAALGFQQFGLTTALLGIVFAYSGAGLYAWRKLDDNRRAGASRIPKTVHLKFTGVMPAVLILDAVGYFIAVSYLAPGNEPLAAVLVDIFIVVAFLTISVGLVLRGTIAHSVLQVSQAANHLATGTLADFVRAMQSLGRGDIEGAHAGADFAPVTVTSRDELGDMSVSFNLLQRRVADAAIGLDAAREGLVEARRALVATNERLASSVNELQSANEAAEAADHAKSAFLAGMSHELRTPLNAILGFSQMISGEVLGPVGTVAYRGYADNIHESGVHLLSTINNILDVARLGAGQMSLNEDQIDLVRMIEYCVATVTSSAVEAGLVLGPASAHDLPPLWGDEVRVRQVVVNLLSNAIKFTPKGGRVSLQARLRPNGALEIAVIDTGIGMTAEHVRLALEPFRQVEGSLKRKYAGTGLGLTLVQGLMHLHGGRVEIASTPGRGTTATLIFPAMRVRNGASRGAATYDAAAIKPPLAI